MKKMAFVFLCVGALLTSNAQLSSYFKNKAYKAYLLKQINQGNQYALKKTINPFFTSHADSVIFYIDSLKYQKDMALFNSYSDTEISSVVKYYDAGNWVTEKKIDYYLDNTLPALPYEPVVVGMSGVSGTYDYSYEGSLGDSVSIISYWDAVLNKWVNYSKTVHNISANGVDTLAASYHWNSTDEIWEVNNIVEMDVVDDVADTVYFTMFYPNYNDTLNFFIYTYFYFYTYENQILKIEENDDGNITVDSMVYDENENLVFEYFRSPGETDYSYAYENRYDNTNRQILTYFWDKQQGQTNWEFDGSMFFYYGSTASSVGTVVNNDLNYCIVPNPSDDCIQIADFEGRITITNLQGLVVTEKTINKSQLIDISYLAQGIYLINLQNGVSRKFIKL